MDRRQALMTGTQQEERTATRFFTTMPVTIYADGVRHVGLLRDFSPKGFFVYSDFQPACGVTLRFALRPPKETAKHVPVECRGTVVRVEAAASGAAIGIAIEVAAYESRKNGFPSSYR
jgi:hypothetical protein